MERVVFTNKSDREFILIIEPIADEYNLGPGDVVEVGPPLKLDPAGPVEIEIGVDVKAGADLIILFVPEEARIKRNGVLLWPEA